MEKKFIFQASEFPGETTIENHLDPETPLEVLNKLASRIVKVFTFKMISIKNLIIFGVIGIIWILLTLLPHLGYNPTIIKILSFLTFSQGGFSNSPIKIFGGLLGKGVFLVFIGAFLDGSIKKIHQGIKPFIRGLKQKDKKGFFFLFLGIGLANITYNFLAGYAAVIKSIISILAFLLILIILKSTRGFLYRFIHSCIRKYSKTDTTKIKEQTNAILSGLGVGFIISFGLSFISFGYTPYFVGLFFVIISASLILIDNTTTKKLLILTLLIILTPLFSYNIFANTKIKGEWRYKKTEYLEYSKELKEYYKNNKDDETQINYEINRNKVQIDFDYLGPGINDDLYEDALKNPMDYIYVDIVLPKENFKITFDNKKLANSFNPDDEIFITVDFEVKDKKLFYFEDTDFYISTYGAVFAKEVLNDLDIEKAIPKEFVWFEPSEYFLELTNTKETFSFVGIAPEPVAEKDVLIIEYNISFYINDYYLNPDYSSEIEEEYFYITMYYFYQWETSRFNNIGSLSEDFPGEDAELSVTCLIVTSTLGMLMVGMLSGIGALKDDDDANLMFYIKKDFDNIIEYGNKEKVILVKVTEQLDDDNKLRPDIMKKIDVKATIDGFKIISKKIIDDYLEIVFKLNNVDVIEKEGSIIFSYEYNDKFIENEITFSLK